MSAIILDDDDYCNDNHSGDVVMARQSARKSRLSRFVSDMDSISSSDDSHNRAQEEHLVEDRNNEAMIIDVYNDQKHDENRVWNVRMKVLSFLYVQDYPPRRAMTSVGLSLSLRSLIISCFVLIGKIFWKGRTKEQKNSTHRLFSFSSYHHQNAEILRKKSWWN
jgi:hypothetical protein